MLSLVTRPSALAGQICLGIDAASLGASESVLPGTAPAEALHTFTLDSGASRCFFRDSTTLTPLHAPIPVRLAGPPGARSLPVPPLTAALQDAMVTTTTPGGQRVSICTCTRTGLHPATFTRRPGSTLYTLATESPQVAASAEVSASRQSRERYLLLVIDDYTRYTTVFPFRRNGQVVDVLIPWIRAVRLQQGEWFCQDLPVLRLRSDRGGEFSFDLLRDFCCGEGILQSFTFSNSPQQNGIAERRIGLVMEVARTSMIHAAAPHFLWPFLVRYAAHQLNLWPPRAIPCIFLGFVPDAHGWHFYHPTSPRNFPYCSAHLPPPPLFLAPGPHPVDPLPHKGPAPSGISQVDPPPGVVLCEIAVDSGAARGTVSGDAEPGGAEQEGAEIGGAEPGGAESGGAEPQGVALFGGSTGALPRLSPQQLREWLVRRARLQNGATGAGGAGVTAGAGGTRCTSATGPGGAHTRGTGASTTGGVGGAGAGDPTEPGAAGDGGSIAGGAGAEGAGAGATGTRGAGAGGAGAGGTGAGGAGARGTDAGSAGVGGTGVGDAGAVDPGGTVRPRPYFVPLLQQVLGVPSSPSLTPPLPCPSPDQSQLLLQPASPLPARSPYTKQSCGIIEHREPTSCPVLLVRTACRAPHPRPPPGPGFSTVLGLLALLFLTVVADESPFTPPPPPTALVEKWAGVHVGALEGLLARWRAAGEQAGGLAGVLAGPLVRWRAAGGFASGLADALGDPVARWQATCGFVVWLASALAGMQAKWRVMRAVTSALKAFFDPSLDFTAAKARGEPQLVIRNIPLGYSEEKLHSVLVFGKKRAALSYCLQSLRGSLSNADERSCRPYARRCGFQRYSAGDLAPWCAGAPPCLSLMPLLWHLLEQPLHG
ncbi:unnamed protein product [Closterium sp. NIES-53]